MQLETLSGPNGSLVTEAEMLAHLGLPTSDGPAIRPYLLTAEEWVDGNPIKSLTGASLRARSLRLTVDLFTWEPVLNLPGPPVTSVTDVEWEDDGTWRTIPNTDWRLRQRRMGHQVDVRCPDDWPWERLDTTSYWWSSRSRSFRRVETGGARVRVTYQAGASLPVPPMVQEATKHLCGNLFAVRNSHLTEEDGITGMARANPVTMRLLGPYTVKTLFPSDTSTPV